MSGRALHSTTSNCRPISSSRSCSAGLRYKLSLRNLAEMFLLRGFEFTHEAVRDWEERFAPLLAEHIRRKRKGKVGRRWYVDETYIKVKGKWCYLYRAIDRDGNLVDSMLSATRDMDAAQRFFRSAQSMVNSAPTQVTTDGHDSYPRAIRETLGPKVKHRCSAYANRRIERDHRGVKQRYYPMLGFGALPSAQRFWRAFEEVRQYFPTPPQTERSDLTLQRQTTVSVQSTRTGIAVRRSITSYVLNLDAKGRLHLSRALSSDSLRRKSSAG